MYVLIFVKYRHRWLQNAGQLLYQLLVRNEYVLSFD